MSREKIKRVRMIKTSDMKREEKHKVGQEFIVDWCKKHKIEIKIQPDYVLDAFECIADALASKPQPKPRANKKALRLFDVMPRLLFWITFKKVPKKQDGRCVTCKANQICSKINVCKCSDEQQYELRLNEA